MRTETMRALIQRLLRKAPFRPFVITLENRQRIAIEYPENIAFVPDKRSRKGSNDFYVCTDKLRLYSTFDAVASASHEDQSGVD